MSLPLEKLNFRARATGAGFGLSKDNATQLAIQLEIVDDENYAGESIAWIGFFTDKTAARTIESLQHMGWKGEDLSELEDLDASRCTEILPEVVEIVCEPEEYEGERRLKVRWVNRLGAGRFTFKKPLVGADLKSFAAQMRATVKSVRGAAGAPRATSGNGQRSLPGGGGQSMHPNAPGNDDVPFINCDVAADPSPISRVLR